MESPNPPHTGAHAYRVAVFGGDARQERRFKHLDEVVFYPGAGCGGPHHAQRLIESIRHGGLSHIFILARWNGHSATRRISDVARRCGVPVTILVGVQIRRLISSQEE